MTAFIPGLPQPGEYHPAFAAYIGKAQSFADPVEKLKDQIDNVLRVLRPLDAAMRLYRYAPGKWSVQEMLGHIIDAERIFAYRALRIARADQTPLASFEENDYVVAAQAERCDWSELLAEFDPARTPSVLLLQHLPESPWLPTRTPTTAPVRTRR